MHHKSSPYACVSCTRHQPCCRNVDLHPIAILPDEVEAFGEEKVIKVNDEVYAAMPVAKSNQCPNYADNECALGSSRPAFCKAYPLIHDGETWYLDAGCPAASQSVFALALQNAAFQKHFRRAFRLLSGKGSAMKEVVRFRVDTWTAPLVVSLRGIPKSWLRSKESNSED